LSVFLLLASVTHAQFLGRKQPARVGEPCDAPFPNPPRCDQDLVCVHSTFAEPGLPGLCYPAALPGARCGGTIAWPAQCPHFFFCAPPANQAEVTVAEFGVCVVEPGHEDALQKPQAPPKPETVLSDPVKNHAHKKQRKHKVKTSHPGNSLEFGTSLGDTANPHNRHYAKKGEICGGDGSTIQPIPCVLGYRCLIPQNGEVGALGRCVRDYRQPDDGQFDHGQPPPSTTTTTATSSRPLN